MYFHIHDIVRIVFSSKAEEILEKERERARDREVFSWAIFRTLNHLLVRKTLILCHFTHGEMVLYYVFYSFFSIAKTK